jgi:Fic family protein
LRTFEIKYDNEPINEYNRLIFLVYLSQLFLYSAQMYNWQQTDWSDFHYDITVLEQRLYAFVEKAGRISGLLRAISKEDRLNTMTTILVDEALKTSEIEGDYLNREDVLSSIKKGQVKFTGRNL